MRIPFACRRKCAGIALQSQQWIRLPDWRSLLQLYIKPTAPQATVLALLEKIRDQIASGAYTALQEAWLARMDAGPEPGSAR